MSAGLVSEVSDSARRVSRRHVDVGEPSGAMVQLSMLRAFRQEGRGHDVEIPSKKVRFFIEGDTSYYPLDWERPRSKAFDRAAEDVAATKPARPPLVQRLVNGEITLRPQGWQRGILYPEENAYYWENTLSYAAAMMRVGAPVRNPAMRAKIAAEREKRRHSYLSANGLGIY